MKTLCFLLLAATPAFAGVACVAQPWDAYQALTDCTIGVYTLSAFNYTDTNTVLADTNILATPFGLGMRFDLTGYNGTGKSITISFTLNGPDYIYGETTTMAASFTGSGIAQVIDPLTTGTYLDVATSRLTSHTSFSPPTFQVAVSDRLTLESGFANPGTATITSYSVAFDTPEPGSIGLVLAGLLVAALTRLAQFSVGDFSR